MGILRYHFWVKNIKIAQKSQISGLFKKKKKKIQSFFCSPDEPERFK